MLVLAASAYLVGTVIGRKLDIRMTISATIIVLLFSLGLRLMGWTSTGDTVFGAFVTIAALQSGYVSIMVLNAFGMVATAEAAARPVKPPSASDNPSHQ